MVLHKILEGARKWMGPWEGFVFMRLRRNRRYFIFWRTSPPERHISSHLTTTTFWPLSSSFARIDASLPSMWWRASTTTLRAQIPDPDTMVTALFLSRRRRLVVLRLGEIEQRLGVLTDVFGDYMYRGCDLVCVGLIVWF